MQIYNSLSKKKEEFQPQSDNTIKIYTCGPTVYDLSHLGHARVFVIWDVIQRYLRFQDYNVIFARNITDIEDKIINRAKELTESTGMLVRPEQLARHFLFEFWKDMKALNVEAPDFEPRATEFVGQMIEFVAGLVKKGRAYPSSGDVYYDVRATKHYGQLTKQNLDDMVAGVREQVLSQTELEARKKHPSDFALWKGALPHELGWQSPWGFGRPGWHLECSTMIKHVLGETIDLHGGGEDLLFPHHENEIAQSEGLHEKPLARFWVHNSFVQVSSEKMSKSLGNFSTIRDLLEQFSADDIRLFILQTHYRNPIDFSIDSLRASHTAVQRLIRAATFASDECLTNGQLIIGGNRFKSVDFNPEDREESKFYQEFTNVMDNDFNTAQAVALLFNLADTIGRTPDDDKRKILAQRLRKYASILGLTLSDTRQTVSSQTAQKLIDLILQLRSQSKQKNDYATSDLIRTELSKCGISVKDTPHGPTWEAN